MEVHIPRALSISYQLEIHTEILRLPKRSVQPLIDIKLLSPPCSKFQVRSTPMVSPQTSGCQFQCGVEMTADDRRPGKGLGSEASPEAPRRLDVGDYFV